MSRSMQLVFQAALLFSAVINAQAGEKSPAPAAPIRAGAAAIDITPTELPVLVNGHFFERTVSRVTDHLFAKALVLDNGHKKLAIVIVDSCMMPRELIDAAKSQAEAATGIPTANMLVAATHTHSAPSAMALLGTRADPNYPPVLIGHVARAIRQAAEKLAPARVGSSVVNDRKHTYCRRWIFRSDRMLTDPFGQRNVLANMHPGYQNPDAIGPSGPTDPGLSLLCVESVDGRPLAVLANYSMHYFDSEPLSADYFGRFSETLSRLLSKGGVSPVVIMSQGTSGDQMWMNYGQPREKISLDQYSEAIARVALASCRAVTYQDRMVLDAAEQKLVLGRRVPDAARLKWAREIIAKMGRRVPRDMQEAYATEQVFLHEQPTRELKIQAMRIGQLGITALPNEVFAISGLKIKAQSPLEPTFNIALANGAEGYIPPPEQHTLGGYTTWPARSAGLEVGSEPRIVSTALELLEQVAGKPRRALRYVASPYASAVLRSKPLAYWPLEDMAGRQVRDAAGAAASATYEDRIALYLEGPPGKPLSAAGAINRCAHFAGGRIKASLPRLASAYSIELWFWNGFPTDERTVTGYLLGIGAEPESENVAISGGTHGGRLMFHVGTDHRQAALGKRRLATREWHHLTVVRGQADVKIYLDGSSQPELVARVPQSRSGTQVFVGGSSADRFNFEGRIDEPSVFGRALSDEERKAHYGLVAEAGTSPSR